MFFRYFFEQQALTTTLELLHTLLRDCEMSEQALVQAFDNVHLNENENENDLSSQSKILSIKRGSNQTDEEYLAHLQRAKMQRAREIKKQNGIMNELLLRCSALFNDLSCTLDAGVGAETA